MKPFICLLVLMVVFELDGSIPPANGQTVESSSIAEKCEALCTTPDAAWRSIPWELDLLKAQRMAVEQSKPIFIWSMDGHPLGCT
jgi:hypothetical protein